MFHTVFNGISVISLQQLTLVIFPGTLKCLAQGHSHKKPQLIQCGLNQGPLAYESNTLLPSQAGPLLLTVSLISS